MSVLQLPPSDFLRPLRAASSVKKLSPSVSNLAIRSAASIASLVHTSGYDLQVVAAANVQIRAFLALSLASESSKMPASPEAVSVSDFAN